MAFAPTQMPTQTPNFTGGGAPAPQMQQAPSGKAAKPVIHGLVDAGEIDGRLAQLPREAQQYIIKAVEAYPELPTIFGIAIGPEAHDYFSQVAQAVKQRAEQEAQNSPQDVTAGTPAGQNPPAPTPEGGTAGGQPPAMATDAPMM